MLSNACNHNLLRFVEYIHTITMPLASKSITEIIKIQISFLGPSGISIEKAFGVNHSLGAHVNIIAISDFKDYIFLL